MKKLFYLICSFLVFFIILACEKRHVDDNIPEASANFSRDGIYEVVFYNIQKTYTDTIYVTNASFNFEQSQTVNIVLDEAALLAYNNTNSSNNLLLPKEAYKLEVNQATLSKDQRSVAIPITFNSEVIESLVDRDQYLLPLQLQSNDGSKIGKHNLIFLKPVLKEAEIKLEGSGMQEFLFQDLQDEQSITLQIATQFANEWEINYELVVGQVVIQEYNQINNRILVPLPSDAYTVTFPDKMSAGTSSVPVEIKILKSKIPEGVYSIGVELKSASLGDAPIHITGDKFAVIRINNGKASVRNPRSTWSIKSFNSQGAADAPSKIYDNNFDSFWQPAWNDSHIGSKTLPYIIELNLGTISTIEGFEIWRRPGKYASDLKMGNLYVSSDGVSWKLASKFDFGDATVTTVGPFMIYCEKVDARYVKIEITGSNRSQTSNCAEFFTLKN